MTPQGIPNGIRVLPETPGIDVLRELADDVWKRAEIDDLQARAILDRLDRAEAALEKISSVPCQIACRSLPGHVRCQGCIARQALGMPS